MKVVHVTWRDSETSDGWESLEDAIAYVPDMMAHTVGFLLREAEEFIAIAHSWDYENRNYNGRIIIPRSSIVKMEVLCGIDVCSSYHL